MASPVALGSMVSAPASFGSSRVPPASMSAGAAPKIAVLGLHGVRGAPSAGRLRQAGGVAAAALAVAAAALRGPSRRARGVPVRRLAPRFAKAANVEKALSMESAEYLEKLLKGDTAEVERDLLQQLAAERRTTSRLRAGLASKDEEEAARLGPLRRRLKAAEETEAELLSRLDDLERLVPERQPAPVSDMSRVIDEQRETLSGVLGELEAMKREEQTGPPSQDHMQDDVMEAQRACSELLSRLNGLRKAGHGP
eukprot:CAMPEP_0197941602 /NCGR_PEP_ID=MMETSP1439-20131203/123038_1 /TAXON_ID=66791 /ORGANISM="Gonyaulax spinifera, Strain CCMP409" /LENGTH=253 /DNA_ID=CAMNT_0043564809 /DNA_START=47 /DNA_END=808 /DNA_ORIENTATION=-